MHLVQHRSDAQQGVGTRRRRDSLRWMASTLQKVLGRGDELSSYMAYKLLVAQLPYIHEPVYAIKPRHAGATSDSL